MLSSASGLKAICWFYRASLLGPLLSVLDQHDAHQCLSEGLVMWLPCSSEAKAVFNNIRPFKSRDLKSAFLRAGIDQAKAPKTQSLPGLAT